MEAIEEEYTKEAEIVVFSKDGEPVHIRPLRPSDADLLDDLRAKG